VSGEASVASTSSAATSAAIDLCRHVFVLYRYVAVPLRPPAPPIRSG
jgi:hypothetical protein